MMIQLDKIIKINLVGLGCLVATSCKVCVTAITGSAGRLPCASHNSHVDPVMAKMLP